MYLKKIILEGFRSFGKRQEIDFENLTAFIGNNDAGKTTALLALNKMFSANPAERLLTYSDFFVSNSSSESEVLSKSFSCEAVFGVEEDLIGDDNKGAAAYYSHLLIDDPDGELYLRIRLEAEWKKTSVTDGTIDSTIRFITTPFGDKESEDGSVIARRYDLDRIRVIYVPAVRDPSRQLKNASSSLLKRLVNSINWHSDVKAALQKKTEELNNLFLSEKGTEIITDAINQSWQRYHSDKRFAETKLELASLDLGDLVKRAQMMFHSQYSNRDYKPADLGDGTRSLFYISNVASVLSIEQTISEQLQDRKLKEKLDIIDQPPILTLVAIEEPENHIGPQVLGKLMKQLRTIANFDNAQVILTSHSPSIIKRVDPGEIRYFRLNKTNDTSSVKPIALPSKNDVDAYKFVKRAVQIYPELYFAQLVVLVEGDSEELLLPRFFELRVGSLDEAGISVVPLGGRFVNHLWKLLSVLEIPFITLLDLDRERSGGGMGRIAYVLEQLNDFGVKIPLARPNKDYEGLIDSFKKKTSTNINVKTLDSWIKALERNRVFFSAPLDIDFLMLKQFEKAYKNTLHDNEGPIFQDGNNQVRFLDYESENVKPISYTKKIESAIKSTLKSGGGSGETYNEDEKRLMVWYNYFFLGRGKPATHLMALAQLDSDTLRKHTPGVIDRLEQCAETILDRGDNVDR
ncbi:MAG: AAA family ATPase [Schleiferilactobacillus harbinensis]|nr:AAA family ATPase [Schleiferilactobacillus harbinensis]MCI1912141.1 AAA family ATPase [Schleiferilactobacillus harbinensis]